MSCKEKEKNWRTIVGKKEGETSWMEVLEKNAEHFWTPTRRGESKGETSKASARRRCGQDCAKARLTLISVIVSCAIMLPLKSRLVFPSYVCLFTPLLKSQTEKVEGRLFRRAMWIRVHVCLFLPSAGNRYRMACLLTWRTAVLNAWSSI